MSMLSPRSRSIVNAADVAAARPTCSVSRITLTPRLSLFLFFRLPMDRAKKRGGKHTPHYKSHQHGWRAIINKNR